MSSNQRGYQNYQPAASDPPSGEAYQNPPPPRQAMSANYYNQPGYNQQYQGGGAAPPPAGWSQQPPQQGYAPPPPMGGMHQMEGGEADKYAFGFSDATIRAGFVRKVFVLVTIMLAVVAVMTAVPFFDEGLQSTLKHSIGLYLASYVTFIIVYLVLMCCESVRRSFPTNLIMTGVLTVSIGFMTSAISAHHSIESVLLCLIICTVVCGSIIIFATVTNKDLTSLLGIAFILSMVLLVFGLVATIASIWFHSRILYLIYAGGAALLFMLYLAIDVQMIMGGKKYELSPEEHIFAAIQIFLDIVYIFWMLLSLFGSSNN